MKINLIEQYFPYSRHTFVLRQPDESPNDRNDRAIRKIAQFYNEHLQQQSKHKEESALPRHLYSYSSSDCSPY